MESIYKIDTGCDHVAKFRGDRPRELGDYALKKRKHHEHFIRPPVTPYERPNNNKLCLCGAKAQQTPPRVAHRGIARFLGIEK